MMPSLGGVVVVVSAICPDAGADVVVVPDPPEVTVLGRADEIGLLKVVEVVVVDRVVLVTIVEIVVGAVVAGEDVVATATTLKTAVAQVWDPCRQATIS